METRLATESDIPEIVNLLKEGLKASPTPKSEQYWRWKHYANPFGKSVVLLAVKNAKIIGVRSFMRWQWKSGNERIESVRGVDTVVHADHQGNGIFGNLTIELMNHCRQQGYHFLYSTPNEGSKRGYLKLGWERPGHLPVDIKIIRPVSVVMNRFGGRKGEEVNSLPDQSVSYFLSKPELPKLLENNDRHYVTGIITAHTVESLQWRYLHVPVGRYYALGVEEHGVKALCFYRIKTSSLGKEMRITDIFLESPEYENELRGALRQHIIEHDIDYVAAGSFSIANLAGGLFSLRKIYIGPAVNLHEINLPDLKRFTAFTNWNPSLGDLELF
jgi:GNAT superfamily N-acetyltransferase